MDLIGYYLLFAFSASLTSCYVWFWPIIQKAKNLGIKNTITTNPILSMFVHVIVTTLVAPVVVLPLLIPSMSESFVRGLEREMLKPD
jgi:ABC-type enterochelin transport system permease subunit